GARDVQVARCCQADATGYSGGQVGNNVAEHVVGDDDIKPARIGGHEDGGRIHVQVVMGDVRVFCCDLVDDAVPQMSGVDQHVMFVDQCHVLAFAVLRVGES